MRVTCSKPFLLGVLLLFLLDHQGFYFLVFAGILVHEVGHLVAILLLRCRVERLELRLSGLNLDYTEGQLSYGRDAIIALAGPGANILAAGLLVLCSRVRSTEEIYLAIGVQVLLAGFNLLPALPMDGGRALQALVSWRWGVEQGGWLLLFTTALVAAGLLGAGLYACKAPWHNPTLLITGGLLLVGLLKKWR